MYQKLLPEENWINVSQTAKYQGFWNFWPYYFEKLDVFPSKNHLGEGNLSSCCTGSQENYGLVGQQNNDNNPKFQGQHIWK